MHLHLSFVSQLGSPLPGGESCGRSQRISVVWTFVCVLSLHSLPGGSREANGAAHPFAARREPRQSRGREANGALTG
jgi:hypothetical protein